MKTERWRQRVRENTCQHFVIVWRGVKLLHAVGKARCGAARSLMPTGKALDDDVDYFRQVD